MYIKIAIKMYLHVFSIYLVLYTHVSSPIVYLLDLVYLLINMFKIKVICICIPRMNVHEGYYGLVVVTPRPQTLHRSHNNLKNPCLIASIFYKYR